MADTPFNPLPPGPSGRAAAVTPNDDTILTATRYLWVGGAGDLVVRPIGQTTSVTFTGVAAGTLLPISVTRVLAATTASDIVAMF